MSSEKLSKCQVCLAKSLSRFKFVITYTQKIKNEKPDLLTYCPNIIPLNNYND